LINWIIDQLFKWDALRTAIFAEVDWQNSLGLILNDPESMKIASAMWYEQDGWRGWTIQDNGTYYFHDVPEKNIEDLWQFIIDKESIDV
jgi:hypothetical protein